MSTIYYGHNRLENWLIDQSSVSDFTRSMVSHELEDVPQSVQDVMVPELRSLSSDESYVQEDSPTVSSYYARRIGGHLIRIGIGILLVPDPIPVVDELIGIGFIVVGSALILLS